MRVKACLVDGNRIWLGKEMARGNFGKVYTGLFKPTEKFTASEVKNITVAVKILLGKIKSPRRSSNRRQKCTRLTFFP